jgi:hypothetical protein
MADLVYLANQALSHCGTRSKIQSLTEDSEEASAVQSHMDTVRRTQLRAFDWNFARMTRTLASISPCSIARWIYEYALPADYVKVRRLNDKIVPLNPVDWYELAGDVDASGNAINVLFTNDATAVLIYTMDVPDPNRWDAGFADAFAYGLAARICFEVTGKDDRVKTLTQMWQGALWTAAAQAANESPTTQATFRTDGMIARGYFDGNEVGSTDSPGWC